MRQLAAPALPSQGDPMVVQPVLELDVPPPVARAVDAFAAAVTGALGARVQSLLVYGSAVQGGYRAGASDLNLLLVLDRVGTSDLERVAALAAAGGRAELHAVVLAEADLVPTARCAPSTLWDARDRHRLLAGRDLLGALTFDLTDLRRQLRAELRDKLYRLRAAYAAAATRPRHLEALLVQSFGSVMHLLRNLLRLYERPADGNPVQTLGEVARTLRLDLDVLRRVHTLRYDGEPLERQRLRTTFEAWLQVVETALQRVEEAGRAAPQTVTEPVPEGTEANGLGPQPRPLRHGEGNRQDRRERAAHDVVGDAEPTEAPAMVERVA